MSHQSFNELMAERGHLMMKLIVGRASGKSLWSVGCRCGWKHATLAKRKTDCHPLWMVHAQEVLDASRSRGSEMTRDMP